MQKNICHTLLTIVLYPDYKRKFLNLKNMSLPPPPQKKNKNGQSAQYALNIKKKKRL